MYATDLTVGTKTKRGVVMEVLCGLTSCPWCEVSPEGDSTVCTWPKTLKYGDVKKLNELSRANAPCARWKAKDV